MKSFLKICPIFLLFLVCVPFFGHTQTITVQPSVETELNLYTDVSLWVSAPAGQQVNTRLRYFTANSDTTVTSNLSNISLGVSHQFVFENLVVDCDSLWSGIVDVWITGQDTIQSNLVTWTLPCGGEVAIDFSVEEIVDTGVVISLHYNSGGVPAGLYWFTSVNNSAPLLNSEIVFGVGTHTDTLFIAGGIPYEVCNPEVNNGIDVAFLPQCISGVMPSFVPTPPQAEVFADEVGGVIQTHVLIENSGDLFSEFTVTVERMLCDGSYEVYDEFLFQFSEVILDSLFALPALDNLPNAPAWRVTLEGSNDSFEFTPQTVEIDVALGITPVVSNLSLTDLGGGMYNAVVTWNDFGAGNPTLLVYLDDVLVASMNPTSNTTTIPIPEMIGAYSGGVVSVTLVSNACVQATSLVNAPTCGSAPIVNMGSAYGITATSAHVQISGVNFQGCVDEAMVGIILVGVDTVWTPLSVNTEQSSNYIIQLTNLMPGQTYVYLGVLYAQGEYFTTNFSSSFTTPSDEPVEPVFTNFNINWDASMLVTLFLYYDLGDAASAGLRVYHDGPNTPTTEVFDVTVSNQFTSIDLSFVGQYGVHIVWAELYDLETNEVYETTDPLIHTFQEPPVSVEEFGQPVVRFDRVDVYDMTGRLVAEFPNGTLLQPQGNFPHGMYVFVGIVEGKKPATSKIYLGQW